MVIASKTGMAPEDIRWKLPLWQGLAYYHAARLLEGELFRWPGRSGADSEWLQDVMRRVRKRESWVSEME